MKLNFAENIKRLRKEKGITQEKLAEILGVSTQSISRWELSVCYPDIEFLPSIANYFGISLDALLSNDVNSKKKDDEIFDQTINNLSSETTQRIDFVKEYCSKYPENDYYAYQLVWAIKDYVVGDIEKTKKYMPLMRKNAQRLLDTQYRNAVIQFMTSVCDEKDIDEWLDMSPYGGFSRRYCLLVRSVEHKDWEMTHIQNGLEMLETFAKQLDRRYPDKLGARKKLAYHRSVLRTMESFGDSESIPDGWKMLYAYKQFVLSACLFKLKETEDGWKNFDAALEKYKYIFSLNDEWLDTGVLFSNLKVSKDWNYAMDESGNKHKLFSFEPFSFFYSKYIYNLLTSPTVAWFDSIRDTDKYQAAVEWVKSVEKFQ